jgi:hypothetical protein
MSVVALTLLFPFAGQAQGGRDAYTDVRVMVKDLSTNQEIGEIPPGGSFDLPDGAKVRLIMRVYAPGRGVDSRPVYPRTTYSEGNPGRGGVRITATNEENANATLELVRLPESAQKVRSELIRYQISDPEGRIPNNLERGSVTINVVPASATGQIGSGTGSTTARRAEELTRVLYQAILLRDPDQGARGTVDAIERGGYNALVQAAVDIANSDESRRLYDQSGMTSEKRLTALYKNLLGLDPSQVDRSVWFNDLQQLGNGQIANVVDELVRSERFRSRYSLNAL